MAALNAPVLLPLIVLAATAAAISALDRSGRQYRLSAWVALASLVIAPVLGLIVITSGQGGQAQNTLYSDGDSMLWTLAFCCAGAAAVLVDLGNRDTTSSLHEALILLLTAGALIVAQAAHWLALSIGVAIAYAALVALSGSQNAWRQIVLCGTSLAGLLMGGACLYGASGSLHIAHIAGQLGWQDAGAANPLVVLGLNLCAAGAILIPATLVAGPSADEPPGRSTGAMAHTLFLPLIGIAGMQPWLDVLAQDQRQLGGLLGAAGIAAGYGLALRARRIQDELAGAAAAEFARLTLIACLAPGTPFLFYQVLGSASAIAGLWALPALAQHANSQRTMSPAAGLGREQPYFGIAFTLCLLSLSGMPPLIGAIGQVWLLRTLAESGQVLSLALVAAGSLIAWLWMARRLSHLWFKTPASPAPLSLEAGTVLLVSAAGIVLAGPYAGSILNWIETMLVL